MEDKAWSLLRIALGLIFLWAFFDKLFGLGNTTSVAMSWLSGGSPTAGFLTHGTTGPLATFYQNLAGSSLVDWVFMLGLLGLGLALTFGICLHLAGWLGALLMILIWSAELPIKGNPFIDDHIIYALALIGFARTDVGTSWSLQGWWKSTALVQHHPFLR